MKNLKFIIYTSILVAGLITTSYAQNSAGELSIEGGLGYGAKIESFAIQAGGAYDINTDFRGTVDLIYFFSGNDSRGSEFNWVDVNINGHYSLMNNEQLHTYLLGGLNFTKLISDEGNIVLSGGDNTDTIYTGLNIGGGIEIPVGTTDLYAEGKYTLSSAHQLTLTGGIRIPIYTK